MISAASTIRYQTKMSSGWLCSQRSRNAIAASPDTNAAIIPARSGPTWMATPLPPRPHLYHFVRPRAGDDRRRHEEAEACGVRPLEAEEARGRDRDPGSTDAREQRRRLRDADPECLRERQVGDVPVGAAEVIGQPQDRCA